MSARASKISDRVALVTGASRGIGLAIAHQLAEAGFAVVLCARSQKTLQKAAKELGKGGGEVLANSCDVSNQRSVAALFRKIEREFGRLDVLVNNAGYAGSMAPISTADATEWRQVMATNLDGIFFCTQAALPLMRRGGVIVNNLSVAAKGIFPGMAAYVASKHGALGFTNVLREELREQGIRVLALLPGATDTDIWQQFWPEAPREKMISPESVARMVVQAIQLPAGAAVNELEIGPTAGRL